MTTAIAPDEPVKRGASAPRATKLGKLTVLCINRGSSSLKFGLYQVAEGEASALLVGQAPVDDAPSTTDGATRDEVRPLQGIDAHGRIWHAPAPEVRRGARPRRQALGAVDGIGTLLRLAALPTPDAIAHRIVHGGPTLHRHCAVDAYVIAALRDAVPFARQHLPPALALLSEAGHVYPGVKQFACLDTAFHHDMPAVARLLPVAAGDRAGGMRRFGFHGLSCESVVHALGHDLPERTIVAHLGHGASVTAILNGRSMDTSMGLTPAGGMLMGTRSGDIDPGLVIHLLRTQSLDATGLERHLEREAGLLGVSGISGDLRVLQAAAPDSDAARLAIAMFCDSARKQIAAMVSVLNGVDLLVFTGGIGEHDTAVRETICAGLDWMGIRLDAARNAASRPRIGRPDSRCDVRVMPSDEDAQMARIAVRLMQVGSREGALAAT